MLPWTCLCGQRACFERLISCLSPRAQSWTARRRLTRWLQIDALKCTQESSFDAPLERFCPWARTCQRFLGWADWAAHFTQLLRTTCLRVLPSPPISIEQWFLTSRFQNLVVRPCLRSSERKAKNLSMEWIDGFPRRLLGTRTRETVVGTV